MPTGCILAHEEKNVELVTKRLNVALETTRKLFAPSCMYVCMYVKLYLMTLVPSNVGFTSSAWLGQNSEKSSPEKLAIKRPLDKGSSIANDSIVLRFLTIFKKIISQDIIYR